MSLVAPGNGKASESGQPPLRVGTAQTEDNAGSDPALPSVLAFSAHREKRGLCVCVLGEGCVHRWFVREAQLHVREIVPWGVRVRVHVCVLWEAAGVCLLWVLCPAEAQPPEGGGRTGQTRGLTGWGAARKAWARPLARRNWRWPRHAAAGGCMRQHQGSNFSAAAAATFLMSS